MITKYLIVIAMLLALTACVQKAYKKTVVFTLQTNGKPVKQTAGIRGNDKPLNWQGDFPMNAVAGDSVYKAAVTFITGYKFTEVKFAIDGEFELQNSGNRRIVFAAGDTTFYNAVFDRNE